VLRDGELAAKLYLTGARGSRAESRKGKVKPENPESESAGLVWEAKDQGWRPGITDESETNGRTTATYETQPDLLGE
jgi:hypothetical protein